MVTTWTEAAWFLPFVIPIAIWVAWSDMSSMKIPNKAVLALLAVLAGIAEILVIRALELTQAVVLAPVHYTLIIWGTFYGWLVFGQLPDIWTWVGAGVIMATGLYTLHRERLAARQGD